MGLRSGLPHELLEQRLCMLIHLFQSSRYLGMLRSMPFEVKFGQTIPIGRGSGMIEVFSKAVDLKYFVCPTTVSPFACTHIHDKRRQPLSSARRGLSVGSPVPRLWLHPGATQRCVCGASKK